MATLFVACQTTDRGADVRRTQPYAHTSTAARAEGEYSRDVDAVPRPPLPPTRGTCPSLHPPSVTTVPRPRTQGKLTLVGGRVMPITHVFPSKVPGSIPHTSFLRYCGRWEGTPACARTESFVDIQNFGNRRHCLFPQSLPILNNEKQITPRTRLRPVVSPRTTNDRGSHRILRFFSESG